MTAVTAPPAPPSPRSPAGCRDSGREMPDADGAAGEEPRHLAGGHLGGVLGPRPRPVGHALLALGVEPGDRVAIHSENRPRVAVHRRRHDRGAGRLHGPVPDQSAPPRCAYLLTQLRVAAAGRRGPGAGRQGAGGPRRRTPALERIVYIEHARNPVPLRRHAADVLGRLHGPGRGRTGRPTRARSSARMAEATERRPRLPHLHLGHHRAAQRGDAHGAQRRVRRRRCSSRAAGSPLRRQGRGRPDPLLPAAVPRRTSRLFTAWFSRRRRAFR